MKTESRWCDTHILRPEGVNSFLNLAIASRRFSLSSSKSKFSSAMRDSIGSVRDILSFNRSKLELCWKCI